MRSTRDRRWAGGAARGLAVFIALALCFCEQGTIDDGERDAEVDRDADGDRCAAVTCPQGLECLEGSCVQGDPCRAVSCPGLSDVCSGGVCVSGARDGDGDGFAARDDCDDEDPAVRPGATETCDGRDEDCDGTADEGGVCPPPSCELSLARESACEGESVTLSWASDGWSCDLSCGTGGWSTELCAGTRALEATPGGTSCSLRPVGLGGTVTCSTTLEVAPLPRCHLSFTATTVTPLESSTAIWGITDAETCRRRCDFDTAWRTIACGGSESLTFTETAECTVQGENGCGVAECSATVTVR